MTHFQIELCNAIKRLEDAQLGHTPEAAILYRMLVWESSK